MKDQIPHGNNGSQEKERRVYEFHVGSIMLFIFLTLSSLQVITRYVVGTPLVWTEELSSHLLIWLTFIGAAGVQKQDNHIRVEIIEEIFPQRVVNILYSVYDVIIILCLVLVIEGGIDLYDTMRFDKLPALRWPLRYVFLICPISCAPNDNLYLFKHKKQVIS